MLSAIIVDDEEDSVALLKSQLLKHCPMVNVINSFTYAPKALEALLHQQPDILFLDIEMPAMNGFQLLEQLGELKCAVIFITAYDQFAIKAFRFNALDYLLKPINTPDLVEAIDKAQKKIAPDPLQISNLKKFLNGEPPTRIAVPDQDGILFIEINDILYAEASNNYTKVVLVNGKTYTLSKTLSLIQEVLENFQFIRVHRQYIVNVNRIKKFIRGEGMYLIMDNGGNIPVARTQKEKLMERFGWL